MREVQVIGLLIVALRIYFIACSVWAREFILYILKVQRTGRVFGEKFANRFYPVMGIVLLIGGIARLA